MCFKIWWRNNGLKYVVMVVWMGACVVLFLRTYCNYQYNPEFYYVHRLLGRWLCISRGSAAVLNLNCAVLLLPMCRCTVSALRHLQRKLNLGTLATLMDCCKGFHIACATSVIVTSVVHFTAHIFNAKRFADNFDNVHTGVNAAQYGGQDPMLVLLNSVAGVTGMAMVLILCLIVSSSTKILRTFNFDLFWYVHKLSVLFYILLLVHGYRGPIRRQTNLISHMPGCNASVPAPEYTPVFPARCDEEPKFDHIGCESWLWVAVPFLLYVFDTVVRVLRRSKKTSIISVDCLSGDVIVLTILAPEGMNFKPGQFVYLSCPGISAMEWHPFSVCLISPFREEYAFTVYIRTTGDWTERLRDQVLYSQEKSDAQDIKFSSPELYVDGPYYGNLNTIMDYPVSVCIAGGIGITPFISFLQDLCENEIPKTIRRLYIIWVVRDIRSIEWFENRFYCLHKKCYDINKPDFFETIFHVTSKTLNSVLLYELDPYIQKRLHYGRPVWRDSLAHIMDRHIRTKVGFFVCGPPCMVHDVKKAGMALKEHTNRLYFHRESF